MKRTALAFALSSALAVLSLSSFAASQGDLQARAAAGDTVAARTLGQQYLDENSGTRDVEQGLKWLNQAANQRDPYAHYALAEYYATQPTPDARHQAVLHYRAAATLGHTDAQWKLGDVLFRMAAVRSTEPADAQRLKTEAIALIEHAATAGNRAAMRNLADRAAAGEGMPANPALAAQWLRSAADAGDADAAFQVAQHLLAQAGGKDAEAGIGYLAKAADGGNAQAAAELASRLEEGRGVAKDLDKALARANQAAALHGAGADALVIRLTAALAPPDPVPAPVIERKTESRVATAKIAATDIAVQPKVAAVGVDPRVEHLHEEPIAARVPAVATPQPLAAAARCTETAGECAEAASLRRQVAQMQEQMTHLQERLAPPDADPHPSRARPQSHSQAPSEMPALPTSNGPALAFADPAPVSNGIVIDPKLSPSEINELALDALRSKDMTRAIGLLEAAASRGDVNAMNNLGMLYLRGTGVAQSRDSAVRWFTSSAERGNGTAASNLGYIYANGVGVSPDTQAAIVWYRKAVALGHQESAQALRTLQGGGPAASSNVADARLLGALNGGN